MTTSSAIPYVVGQWVRGDAFYGRSALIHEVLDGPRNALWIVGTRRVGKTSLLKQIEYLTSDRSRGFFPLFWDLQGSDTPEELSLGFGDALLDAEDRFHEVGIDDLDPDRDLFVSLNLVRRGLQSRGLRLLLLCDEAEELINLNAQDPALLGKLRKALQGREGIRTVITSTIKLWALSSAVADTSPFLHGFAPPLYLHRLEDEEADALVRQDHLPVEDRPAIELEKVRRIWQASDKHPYLTQILAKRYAESGDLDAATGVVANDRMVSYFFSVDYEMLESREKSVLQILGDQDGATSESICQALGTDSVTIAQDLQRLADLGFIAKMQAGQYELTSFFFRRWLEDLRRDHPVDSRATSPAESGESTSAHPVPLGTVAERYELLQRVGEGASAIVYKSHDRLLDTTIAVKQFKPGYLDSKQAIERLRIEALLARDLAHPNIVRIYDVGSFRDRAFITMQWIEGPTLEQQITELAPFDEREIIRITRELSGALACAHQKNVLHRDVKPSNVLLSEGSVPLLGDFGLARTIGGAGITSQGMFLGTPYYASPEQADARDLDGRSDIYSLGVIMFEMATGQRPFEAETRQEVLDMHRSVKPRDPREVNPLLSNGISAVITTCLEKDVSRRPKTAMDLDLSLEALRGSTES